MVLSTLQDSYARLQANGHRLTTPRRLILEELHDRPRALTALELHRLVIGHGVSLASVYRTLEMLVALGLAETAVRTGDEERYIACSPRQHHHHVVCNRCGQVAEVTGCVLEEFEKLVRDQTHFSIESHTVEFRGYCTSCRR